MTMSSLAGEAKRRQDYQARERDFGERPISFTALRKELHEAQ